MNCLYQLLPISVPPKKDDYYNVIFSHTSMPGISGYTKGVWLKDNVTHYLCPIIGPQNMDFKLLKEAHDHAYGIADSNLKWSIEKSWSEFLKQNNLVESWVIYIGKKAKLKHREMAKTMRKNGMTVRAIANNLGYKNPGSVSHLLKK